MERMSTLERRKSLARNNAEPAGIALVAAGILFPLAFAAWALSTHDGMDNIRDYGPVRDLFLGIVGAGFVVLIASIADLWNARGKAKAFPSMQVKLIAILGVLGAVAVAASVFVPYFVRSGDVAPQVLLVSSAGGGGMPTYVVAFYTEKPTENVLEWGAEGGERFRIEEAQASNRHWFVLTGLEPGKEYEYSLNGRGVSGFRTVPADGTPLRFAASGDPHFGAENSRNDITEGMLAQIAKPENNYSMFFLLGDSVQHGFSDAMWKEAFASYSKTSSSVPTGYVVGNHDAIFGGTGLYEEYLCPPGMESPLKECYVKRIDSGNAHFILLDVEWELASYTPEEKEWLERELAGIPKEDWIIVMSHTFYYSSGSHMDGWNWYDNNATINELVPLFEKNGVDIVLSGHKHHSEVLEKNGITYVVVGSFGGVQNPERTYASPASLWYTQGQFGFVDITIQNSTDAELVFRGPEMNELFKKEIKQKG